MLMAYKAIYQIIERGNVMKKTFKKFFAVVMSLILSLGVLLPSLTVQAEEAKEFEGRTLNVVATSESYVPLFDLFTEQTGASVEFLSMSSGEVLARSAAEGQAMADLWFGGGLDAFMQAKEDGLLEQHELANPDAVDPRFYDEEGYWFSKGLTVVGFLINNENIEALGLDVPTTWAELVDEQYKDEVIMSDPAVSGTNYAAVKGILDLFGEEEGWEYIEGLNENILFYGKRGSDPREKTSQGEFTIGIIPADKTSFDLAEDNNLTVIYPEDGVPWVPEGVAVFKGGENVDVAKAFVDFMLTPEAQEIIAEVDGKDSAQLIVEGVEGYDLGLPVDLLVEQDLSTFGSMREDILTRFQEIAGEKTAEQE